VVQVVEAVLILLSHIVILHLIPVQLETLPQLVLLKVILEEKE
tara:strand:- start:286 stop:414 length:129 start_codon:yes stop_codon:yes gene_type:complete